MQPSHRASRCSLAAALLGLAAHGAFAQPLAGHWTGEWVRDGSSLPVTMDFVATADGHSGSFDSDALQVAGIPLQAVRSTRSKVSWKVVGDESTTTFEGDLHGDLLEGELREGAAPGTFRLRRTVEGPPPPDQQELVFRNGDLNLAGTLLLPREGTPPFPLVVFLHGSGAEGRWASRYLALRFARAGIAGFVYDKRGVGQSTGDWRTASFDDLVGDAAAAIAALRLDRRIDPARVGIFGHSQGATIAPAVSVEAKKLAFVVAASATGLPMDQTEIYSLEHSLAIGSLPPPAARQADVYVKALVDTAYHGGPRERLLRLWEKAKGQPWAMAPPAESDPYWAFSARIAAYDPIAWWRRSEGPVLLLYGDQDDRVPARRSAELIAQAVLAGRSQQLTARIFPGADHSFRLKAARGPWPKVAPGYPELMLLWVADVVGRPRPSSSPR